MINYYSDKKNKNKMCMSNNKIRECKREHSKDFFDDNMIILTPSHNNTEYDNLTFLTSLHSNARSGLQGSS